MKNPELLRRIEEEAAPRNRILVSSSLRSPHPIVVETQRCIRDATPDQYGKIRPHHVDRLSHLDIRVTKSSIPRVLLILDALAKALERRGHRFELHGEGWHRATYLNVLGERFSIQVSEKSRQTPHKPTEEENRRKDSVGFLYFRSKYDYVGTGVLDLHLVGDNGYSLNVWRDGSNAKIEDCLNDFVIATYVAVEQQQERRRRQQELEIERRQAEQRRWEDEQRRREELAHRKELEEMAAAWAKAQQIRKFLVAIKEACLGRQELLEEGSKLSTWISWAEKQADFIDPLVASFGVKQDPAEITNRQTSAENWTAPDQPR